LFLQPALELFRIGDDALDAERLNDLLELTPHRLQFFGEYDWLKSDPLALPAPPPPPQSAAAATDPDTAILQILASLSAGDPL
jgi:hypothetical protein